MRRALNWQGVCHNDENENNNNTYMASAALAFSPCGLKRTICKLFSYYCSMLSKRHKAF